MVVCGIGLAAAASADQPVRAGRSCPHQMVVAANPLAAQAGLDILRQGGNAVDAAVAVQMVLALVEPSVLRYRRRRFLPPSTARARRSRRMMGARRRLPRRRPR
mgnify:CR=1 FL=1